MLTPVAPPLYTKVICFVCLDTRMVSGWDHEISPGTMRILTMRPRDPLVVGGGGGLKHSPWEHLMVQWEISRWDPEISHDTMRCSHDETFCPPSPFERFAWSHGETSHGTMRYLMVSPWDFSWSPCGISWTNCRCRKFMPPTGVPGLFCMNHTEKNTEKDQNW